MKRREKAGYAVLKELDRKLSRTARRNRGNDEQVAMIIASEVAVFEKNTGLSVDKLIKSVVPDENGRCPERYRLIHIRPMH